MIRNIYLIISFLFMSISTFAACPTANSTITTDFTVNEGDDCFLSGTLTMNRNNKTLTIDGNIEVTSTFTLSKGTVIVNANDTLTIGGSLVMSSNTTFIINGTLVMSSGGNIAANGTFTMNGTIILNGGDFTVSNGNSTGITAGPDGVVINNGGGTVDTEITGVLGDGSAPCDGVAGTCCGNSSSCDVALPVELTSFTTSKLNTGTVLLEWSTASEIDNDGFFIEKSIDKRDSFEEIGFITGHGTTKQAQEYQFIDNNAHDIIMYRLRQVDFDGMYEYSGIEIIRGSESSQLAVYPNPTTDGKISIKGITGQVSITLTDMYAKQLISINNISINEAEAMISNEISRNNSQSYFLQVSDGLETQVTRIMKK